MQLPPGSEVAAWQEIARQCGGHVVMSGPHAQRLYFDNREGTMGALEHYWIVRDAEGAFRTMSADEFAAEYEPAEDKGETP